MVNSSLQQEAHSNRFEVFFKNASLGILVVDVTGSIISANPFLLNMFGYKETGILGKTIETLIPSRFHHGHVKHRDKFIKKPNNRPMGIGMDLFGIKKDGTEFPVEVSLGHYTIDEEKFVVAFVSDITIREKNKAEIKQLYDELEITVENRTKELTRTLQVLEHLNEKLEFTLGNQKAILDNARIMLFAMNKNGLIQFFNPEACRLTGYAESEVVNHFTPVMFHQPEEIEHCKQELKRDFNVTTKNDFEVIKEKSLRNQINEMECVYRKKTGEMFPVLLTITPIRNKKQQVTGFMGVAIDISERKKAESNLLEALKKEQKLGELKSRFVSMASHEFRTPLSTILSSAYLVEKYKDCEDQPKREKHLGRIISAVNNLTNILNEFLSVGKIEEGKINLHLSPFNIKKTTEQLIQDMLPSVKGQQFIDYVHQGEETTTLDLSLYKNIILNLLSNAIKFSKENSGIYVNTYVDETQLQLTVKDSGIGISKEDQEHLMERFFRGSNATNIQGTGLGLHIVSKYVERLKGTLSFSSELEVGTTFTITFKPQNLRHHEDITID